MFSSGRVVALCVACLVTLVSQAQDLAAPTGAPPTVSIYPPDFFSGSKTSSAFDMLALLPGYRFVDADTELRGLAGASGNVLIDGTRPASKYDSLEDVLRRIPATSVARIELIRAGTPGIDMQGHTVLANVVRERNARMRGSVEVGSAVYERDFQAPRVAGELAHRTADRLMEFSASAERTIDDEHGAGSRPRVSPQGQLLRDGEYSQDEGEQIAAAAGGYESAAFGGKLQLRGSLQRIRSHADIHDEATFPTTRSEFVREFERETSAEWGAYFERALSEPTRFELSAIQRNLRSRGGEHATEPDEVSSFREASKASESIVRALVRHRGGRVSFEGGLETALNSLDSHGRLTENGIEVPIPGADLNVEERRGEAFAGATFVPSETWQFELGARFEYSELEQSGERGLSKTFFFPKPRMLLAWSHASNRVRLLVERTVGQLDFEDFASSPSLSTGTVTAGNPDLEPDRAWRTEIGWERPLLDQGAIMIAARRDFIESIVDRIPVVADTTFDAIGNIGSGVRDELEIDLTLPLDRLGVSGGMLKAQGLWRRTEATDPVTGATRPISEQPPLEATLQFQQALTVLNARWGIDLTLPTEEREYRFDEVRTDRIGTMLNLFVECEPVSSWRIRLFANNLTDRSAERRREVYEGMRNTAAVRYIETRTLAIGRYAGLDVRWNFGG